MSWSLFRYFFDFFLCFWWSQIWHSFFYSFLCLSTINCSIKFVLILLSSFQLIRGTSKFCNQSKIIYKKYNLHYLLSVTFFVCLLTFLLSKPFLFILSYFLYCLYVTFPYQKFEVFFWWNSNEYVCLLFYDYSTWHMFHEKPFWDY